VKTFSHETKIQYIKINLFIDKQPDEQRRWEEIIRLWNESLETKDLYYLTKTRKTKFIFGHFGKKPEMNVCFFSGGFKFLCSMNSYIQTLGWFHLNRDLKLLLSSELFECTLCLLTVEDVHSCSGCTFNACKPCFDQYQQFKGKGNPVDCPQCRRNWIGTWAW
jgi:hypothetical protein